MTDAVFSGINLAVGFRGAVVLLLLLLWTDTSSMLHQSSFPLQCTTRW
jgi:hypothetical protein